MAQTQRWSQKGGNLYAELRAVREGVARPPRHGSLVLELLRRLALRVHHNNPARRRRGCPNKAAALAFQAGPCVHEAFELFRVLDDHREAALQRQQIPINKVSGALSTSRRQEGDRGAYPSLVGLLSTGGVALEWHHHDLGAGLLGSRNRGLLAEGVAVSDPQSTET